MKITEQDKQQIVKLAKTGQDANAIRKTFKQYTRQQIAAIIAWLTMGKFGGGKQPTVHAASSTKFTEDELGLVRKVYPIHGANKTEKAVSSLRAGFKKHRNMVLAEVTERYVLA